MSTLQQALAALRIQTKPATKPQAPAKARKPAKAAPPRVHRCELNAFTQHQPLRLLVEDETGRHTDSRPPPEHEPAFAERYFPPVETLVYRTAK